MLNIKSIYILIPIIIFTFTAVKSEIIPIVDIEDISFTDSLERKYFYKVFQKPVSDTEVV